MNRKTERQKDRKTERSGALFSTSGSMFQFNQWIMARQVKYCIGLPIHSEGTISSKFSRLTGLPQHPVSHVLPFPSPPAICEPHKSPQKRLRHQKSLQIHHKILQNHHQNHMGEIRCQRNKSPLEFVFRGWGCYWPKKGSVFFETFDT